MSGMIGPHFHKGLTRLGRNRLPTNHVAILDDSEMFRLVVGELFDYAISDPPDKPKFVIVFDLVIDGERDHLLRQLHNHLGPDGYNEHCGTYGIALGHWYAIDSNHTYHAWKEHGAAAGELGRGQVPLTPEDFVRVPDIVRSRYIVEFAFTAGMPRIVYEREFEGVRFRVVMEVRKKTGLHFVTMYKRGGK